MQYFATKNCISKQALHKHVKKLREHLKLFNKKPDVSPELAEAQGEIKRQNELISHLRRQLIISSSLIFLLKIFKERIKEFIPAFKVTRYRPLEKWQLLLKYRQFIRAGGGKKAFCEAIGKSPNTLSNWQKRYDKYGLGGLADKTSRPQHYGHKIPRWVKEQLLLLFLRFPNWTPWQYYKHMKYNPTIQWHVSIPVIKKMKMIHTKRRADESERIKKRWCFAPGTKAWTIDFTTIIKTGRYQLRLLTVSDQRSRMLFESGLFLDASTENVIEHLERLFLRYGKPNFIKADNGPEFRMDCREKLGALAVDLLSSPAYYGQFCGSHERLHRTLKSNITKFSCHRDLFRLLKEISQSSENLNHHSCLDCLDGKTPVEVFYDGDNFIQSNAEVIKPYYKDGELRMKFTNRNGGPARVTTPHHNETSAT